MSVALFGGNDLIIIEDAEVDGKLGEFHEFTASPTSFAIENGANSTDHIFEAPDKLEISWVMSNLDEQGASYGNRAATLMDELRNKIKRRELYQVVTRHRLYTSMAVVSIRAEHLGPFTGSLRGRIAFQEVNRALLERIRLPVARVPRKTSAASQQKAGRVEGTTPTPAQQTRAKDSVFAQARNRS